VLRQLPLQPALHVLPDRVGAAGHPPRAGEGADRRASTGGWGARIYSARRDGRGAVRARLHARVDRDARCGAAHDRPLERDGVQRPATQGDGAARRSAGSRADLPRPPRPRGQRRDARARELPQGRRGHTEAGRARDRGAHRHHPRGPRRSGPTRDGAPVRAAPLDGHPGRGSRRATDHQPRARPEQRPGRASRVRAARARAHAHRRRSVLQPLRPHGKGRRARHRPACLADHQAPPRAGGDAGANRREPPGRQRRLDRHQV
ncbi:MAG: hypothetical protein AVDCRST_MAG45-657, partial [uncultured Solirubrobacterales bacterium]